MLSGYANHRDPNQGSCTNSCRWKYDAHEAKETPEGNYSAIEPIVDFQPPMLGSGATSDQVYLLQEQNRPGEYMPAFEDEHGTYIMNSRDLRAVQHVQKLIDIGVDSLKIEGRTKSHYYVSRTTQVYRKAIDLALQGQGFDMSLMDDLEKLSNRGYTEGFYRRHVHDEYQSYEQGTSIAEKQQFVGEVLEVDNAAGKITVEAKNRFEVGDTIEIMSPAGNQRVTIESMESENGEPRQAAPGSGHIVKIPVDTSTINIRSLLLKEIASPIHT